MKTKKLELKNKITKSVISLMAAFLVMVMLPLNASAHCDTMDGPTVADGQRAMAENNVNYALKWVQPDYEEEIKQVFDLSMKVKDLSPESKEIAEKYFYGELIRIHRAGEGAPYTGLKPSGTPVDEKVLAADESIAVGNLSPLENLVEEEQKTELQERFENVMTLKDFDVNDVEAGREYIEAYVKFFKFAEGEEEHGEAHGEEAAHGEETANGEETIHEEEATESQDETNEVVTSEVTAEESTTTNWLPWSLAGLFLVTTIVSHIKLFKSTKK